MSPFTINPSISGFSRETALYLANACDLAYSNDPAKAARDLLGLEAEPFNHKPSDTHGFVGRAPGFAVLAFRGSEEIRERPTNWVVNLRYLQSQQVPYTGRVHSGFSTALAAAWDNIDSVLRRALPAVAAVGAADPGLPLYVTGHSLGGALATLASCRLGAGELPALSGSAAVRVNLRASYTFGAPRVGDPDFCRAYTPTTFRVVHNLDLVPLVPLETSEAQRFRGHLPSFTPPWIQELLSRTDPVPDYGDVGTLIYLDARGRVTEGGARPNWPDSYIRQSLRSLFRSINAPINDHMIDAYITSLASNEAG